MVRQQLFIGAALIAGVAIGFFVRPEPEKASVPEKSSSPAALIPDEGESATIVALRRRVRELEARLAGALREDAAGIPVSNDVAVAEGRSGERRPPRESFRDRMEEMRTKDPARFAQMTNFFARMRMDRKDRQAARAQFLSSVNTSHMGSSAKKTHDAYQELLARREELEEKMSDPDLTEDARRELMNEMRTVSKAMREASGSERQVLLGEVAHAVGLEGEAATELVETVSDVIEATEGGHGPGGPGGPEGGPGGPEGGPEGQPPPDAM